jgi:polar amino acid transport system substrate-binding protein
MTRLSRLLAAAAFLLGIAGVALPAAAQAPGKCEPDKIAAKYPSLAGKALKVSVPADSPPLSFRDPKNLENIVGFFVDYARAAFSCIGAPVEFSVATFSGLLPAVTSGQTDLVWALLYYTAERAKSLDFILYMRGSSGVVVLKSKPTPIHAMTDLCGKRIAAPAGSVELADIQKASDACIAGGKAQLTLFTTPDRAAGLRLLDNDRVDATFGIGLKQVYDQNLYTFAFTYLSDLELGVGTRKGNTELEKAILDALTTLVADGTVANLYKKYDIDPALRIEPKIATQ